MSFWGWWFRRDRGRGRCLSGKGGGIFIRRRDQIGTLGFDFDATVTGTGTGDQFHVGMGKKKEADAKEDDRGRCCDNAERDEVEQGTEASPRCPGALIREVGERTRCFGGL
jgi:hypothetical protein